MQTTNPIAIIGANGTVGQALTNGFTDKNTITASILPVLRKDLVTSTRQETIRNIQQCETVILAVKPTDAIDALSKLQGGVSKHALFVSTVTGLNIEPIRDILGLRHSQVVKSTLNITVAERNGIIVCSTAENTTYEKIRGMFGPLTSSILRRPGKRMLPFVTMIGSGDAFVAKCVFLYALANSKIPFVEFLQSLTMKDPVIQNYVVAVTNACMELFGENGSTYVLVESVLEALKATCFCIEDIQKHIDRVATKGGCTREGIDEFDDLSKVTKEFFIKIFFKVHAKAMTFEASIRNDFKLWKNINRKFIDKGFALPQGASHGNFC